MDILLWKLFKLLQKRRKSKLASMLDAKNDAAKLAEVNWVEDKKSTYTVVDPVAGGRKVDMMIHMGSKAFELSNRSHKTGKSRWHVNATEQHYKPRTVKPDAQLEFMYDELGLSQNIEQTEIGPSKRH